MGTHADPLAARPRVEGEREEQILTAALDVLAEVGYDRLTMDAVAARAKASKATLYRRWNGKVALVVDAILLLKATPAVPDTGTLRGDLLASFCGAGGLTDQRTTETFSSVLTAISRDPEFAAAFRRDVLGPKIDASTLICERARDRGEVCPGVDLDLLAHSLAGIVLHRLYVLGEPLDDTLVTRVIDQIVLPAASAGLPAAAPPDRQQQKEPDLHGPRAD